MLFNGRSIYKYLRNSELFFAFLVSLTFALPIGAYVVYKHATIAPLNLLNICCGWKQTPVHDRVNYVPSDVVDFVLPNRFFVKHTISKGQIPLWNPSYFGGETFLADVQSTVLHPVNLFHLVTDELNVQTISVIISLLLLFTCTTLMLRQLGRSRIGSAVGGLALAGSSFSIFWASFGMMTWMMAMMPLTIYLFLRWQKSAHNKFLGWMALCLGLQAYFGHVQFSFLVYVCLVLFASYYFLFQSKPGTINKKTLLLFFSVLIAGALISSAQLLPFIEQARIGHRAGATLTTGPASWSVIWLDIRNFFSVYNFGNAGSQVFNTDYGPFRYSIGLLPALFIIIATLKSICLPKKSRTELFFLFLLIFAALWMWGSLPQQILNLLSDNFKSLNPRYFMALGLFAAACLSAFGYDQLYGWAMKFRIASGSRLQIYLKVTFAGSACLALMYPLLIVSKQYSAGSGFLYGITVIAILSCSVVATFLLKSYRMRAVFSIIPFLYILINALLLFYFSSPVIPKTVYKAGNPMYEFIIQDSPSKNPANIRIISPFDPQTNLFYGLSALNGYSALYAKDTETLIHAFNYPSPTFELTAGPNGSHNYIMVSNLSKLNLLENLGVQYIIAPVDQSINGYQKVYASENMQYGVFKSNRPAPQIYFALSTKSMTSQEQLDSIQNNSLDYHEVALEASSKGLTHEFSGVAKYDIDINRIDITTHSNQDQYLFIGQTYRSQWQAHIDGHTTPISRANYNFMAIDVPPGDHHIELTYKSEAFRYGHIISASTIGGTIAYIVYCRRKQSSSKHRKHRQY